MQNCRRNIRIITVQHTVTSSARTILSEAPEFSLVVHSLQREGKIKVIFLYMTVNDTGYGKHHFYLQNPTENKI